MEELELLRKALKAWDALDGDKRYSPKVIESWLANYLEPVFKEIREFVNK